jgi:diacylglycerol kinase family enzyme
MRICLFWNESAGEGISLEALRSHIARAGHTVTRVVERSADLRDHLHHDFDAVAAAGGDGTIARAGRALVGGDIPLGILPLGTANNIATSLGIEGEMDQLMSRWSLDRVVRIDAGALESPGGRELFLESVGTGLFADVMDLAQHTIAKDDPDTHLDDARKLYADTVARLEPRPYVMRVGDQDIAGEYLLVEVLNTPFIGPGVKLTSDVSAADGLLSVIAVAASERAALMQYFESLRRDVAAEAGFKSWRVPQIEISGADRAHIDDRVRVENSKISIRILPSALPVLA